MEAATPLRQPHVRVLGDVVAIDGLVVDDECAVRVVREREQNGDDPAKTVRDAVEIGARVLDREQAGANAEFVKTEFEKAATDLNSQFTNRAREVANTSTSASRRSSAPRTGTSRASSRSCSRTAAPRRFRTASGSWYRRR